MSYPLEPEQVYIIWKKLNTLSSAVFLRSKKPKLTGSKFEDLVLRILKELNFPPPFAGRASPVPGISSVRHEHDLIIRPPHATGNDFLLIECKYRKSGSVIPKDDVMIFNQKALDIFWRGKIRDVAIRSLYRIFISNAPLDHNAFRFCLSHGILVLQPFYNRVIYPSGIACYPPLQVAYWNLLQRRFPMIIRREIDDLISDIQKLMKQTFRKVSEIPDSSEYDGLFLHRKYLDIILRTNVYIKGEW
jgi:hypothetical protein